MDMYGYVGMAETWLGFVMNIFCFSYIHWKPPPSKNDFLIVVKWMRILDASIVFFYGILSMPKPIFPTCVIIIYGPVKFLGPVVSNLAVGAGLLSTQAVTVAILISYIVRHNVFVRGVKTFDFIYPDKIALSLYITFVMIPFFPLWSQILLDRDEIEETFFGKNNILDYYNNDSYFAIAYCGSKTNILILIVVIHLTCLSMMFIYLLIRKYELNTALALKEKQSVSITKQRIVAIKNQLNFIIFFPTIIVFVPFFTVMCTIFFCTEENYCPSMLFQIGDNCMLFCATYFVINPFSVYYFVYYRPRIIGLKRNAPSTRPHMNIKTIIWNKISPVLT